MWTEVLSGNLANVSRFGEIQRSMGGNYLKYTQSFIEGMYGRKNQLKAFIYEDADYQIALMFSTRLTHPIAKCRGRIQIITGGMENAKNNLEGMKISCAKIKEYLQSQGRNGYAIVDSTDLDPKAIPWYAQIQAGMQSQGIKFSTDATWPEIQYYDLS